MAVWLDVFIHGVLHFGTSDYVIYAHYKRKIRKRVGGSTDLLAR